MEFVRQIVNGNTLARFFTLPPSFRDVDVEVIVLPVEKANPEAQTKPANHSAFGRLNAYANPALIADEAGAWEQAAAEKYALH
jgi:hypothetical protein